MDDFTPAGSDFRAFRDGFAVAVWTDGRNVVVRARPQQDGEQERVPALPTSARIVVWEPRRGLLRDRLRRPSLWSRFVAWLQHRSVPGVDEQIELLADELVTAIEHAEPTGAPWAETQRGDQPATARPRVVAAFAGRRKSRASRIARLGVVVAVVLALSAGAAFALWRTASGDANAGEPIVLAESVATVDAGDDEPASVSLTTATATPTATAAAEDDSAASEADEETTSLEHVVTSGDTLAAIARSFGVSVADLRSANALGDNDPIYPGQVLSIP